jgi:hypothetical protein
MGDWRAAMMVLMNTNAKTNNQRLVALVDATGLNRKQALALFNAPLGPAGYSYDYWKGFFCDPASTRYKPLRDDLMMHAEKVFAKLAKRD